MNWTEYNWKAAI